MTDTQETLRKPGEGAQQTTPEKKNEVVVEQKVDNSKDEKIEQEQKKLGEKVDATASEIAKMKQDKEFEFVSARYPAATELKDKIFEKVATGMSVTDASVLVLHQNQKLQTREEVESDEAARQNMGGSAPTMIRGGNPKIEDAVRKMNAPGGKITEEELTGIQSTLREALVEEERKGTFSLTND